MSMTAEPEGRYGLTIHIARCDDCEHVLHAATDSGLLLRHLRRSQRHGWQPGLPIFCPDQVACAERTWQRHGRYLQRLIDQAQTLIDQRVLSARRPA